MLLWSCAIDVTETILPPKAYDNDSNAPLIEYLSNQQNPLDTNFKKEIKKAVNYAKLPYRELSIFNFNNNPVISPTTRVLVIFDTKALTSKAMEAIVNFISNGGHLFIPNSQDKGLNFGFLAGVKNNATYDTNEKAHGYVFKNHFLPQFKNKEYKSQTIHYGLKRENFLENVEVLVTAINDPSYPVILKNKIGNGNVVVFNTSYEAAKSRRGLYFSALLLGLEQVPYPIANVSVIFLDDFPSPLYNIRREPVQSEMNMTMSDFYTKIWWPDMLKLSKEENLKYTVVPCFDYRNHTNPPYTTQEWESIKIKINGKEEIATDWLMRDIKNNGHELGLHGYNHISLLKEEWQNENFMETSILTAYKKWKSSNYGRLPVTYVPPSNLIDSIGLASLEKRMPSIKYVSSSFFGNYKNGGNREFDTEPYNQTFFSFPRNTSSFSMENEYQFDQQSLYLYTGIWSHFVHPDNIYQIPGSNNEKTRGEYNYRNAMNLGWYKSKDGSQGMFPRFTNYIKSIKKTYPFMRFLKAETAAEITQNWRVEKFSHTTDGEIYRVSLNKKEFQKSTSTYWFCYVSEKKFTETEVYFKKSGFKYSKTPYLEGYLYNIKTPNGILELPNSNNPNIQNEVANHSNSEAILKKYRTYVNNKKIFKNINDQIKWFVSEGKIDEAISTLQKKIETLEETFIQEDWVKLYLYMGWQNRQNEIWAMLEKAYKKSKKNEYIELSKMFVLNSDYPNLEIRKRWMKRQLSLYPNDNRLLKEYLDYFEGAYKNTHPKSLINLILHENTAANKTKYSLLLLNNSPKSFLNFLEDKIPCEESFLISIADSIAWLFANDGDYENAIAWAKCSTLITKAEIIEWNYLNKNIDYLKENAYPRYIQYLLENSPKNAINELMEVSPCTKILIPLSTTIAYSFADRGFFRKALEWAPCSNDIAVNEKLQWLYEMKSYDEMEKVYNTYILNHPEDFNLKLYMAHVYAAIGEIKKSWIIASSLPLNIETKKIHTILNNDVMYINEKDQKELLINYPKYFSPEVFETLTRQLRLETNNTLEIKNKLLTDRLKPTSIANEIQYGFYDKKENNHSFSTTQYIAPELDLDSLVFTNNASRSLYGIEYGFKSRERISKSNYNVTFRVEMDEFKKVFFRMKGGISISKNNLFSSLVVSHKPAVTGPAYALSIYKTNLTIYEEIKFTNHIQAILFIEGNYYSDGVLNGQLTGNFGKHYKIGENSKLLTYLESAGVLGNKDYSLGFPYWVIEKRYYGGIGLNYSYKNDKKQIALDVDASTFLDSYSGNFQRYKVNVKLPIMEYLYLNTNVEFYTLKNYFSNNFSLGIKYYFK